MMKFQWNKFLVVAVLLTASAVWVFGKPADVNNSAGVYGFTMQNIDGKPVELSQYRGKVALVVNVASKCGFTPQYEGLEKIYEEFKDQGFVILGFPANNFGGQEPGTNPEIKQFCTSTYGVTFPMFAKISVKGSDKHPLYQYLTSEETNPKYGGEITWNFNKFLVGRDGEILNRFDSKITPESNQVIQSIKKALASS